MHAPRFVTLATLAAFAGSAAAQGNGFSAAAIPHGGFIKTGITAMTSETASPDVRVPAYRPPCTDTTFSELGHGHADVAGAGYTAAHCAHYDESIGAATTAAND